VIYRIKLWFFVFIFLSGVSFLFAGEVKIALIGDTSKNSAIADLALAEISGDNTILVMERKLIDKIIREHKLNSSGREALLPFIAQHVDIFVVVSSPGKKKENLPPLLSVFNAKNGFLLLQSSLPQDSDKAAAKVCEYLRMAIKKNVDGKKYYLSVFNFRDAGTPSTMRRKTNSFVSLLEQRLSLEPDLVVLDRRNLDKVTSERDLTKEYCKLFSSAILLRLEFEQGSSADMTNLILRATGRDGKELFRLNLPDCLKNPEATVSRISRELPLQLKKITEASAFSAKEEAKWLFRESLHLCRKRKYALAYYKISSAVALDPSEHKYRHGKLKLLSNYTPSWMLGSYSSPYPYEEIFRMKIKEADKYAKDFPQLHDAYEAVSYLFEAYKLPYMDQKKSPKVPGYVFALAKELRLKYFREKSEKYPELDLSDGINSVKEYNAYCQSYKSFNYYMFHDPELFSSAVVDVFEKEAAFLLGNAGRICKEMPDFFWAEEVYKKNGEVRIRPSYLLELFWRRTAILDDELGCEISPAVRNMVLKKCGRIADLFKKQKNRRVRAMGAFLEIIAAYQNKTISNKEACSRIDKWLDKKASRSSECNTLFIYTFQALENRKDKETFNKIRLRKLAALKKNIPKPALNEWQKFIKKIRAHRCLHGTVEEIIKNIDYIHSCNTKESKDFVRDRGTDILSYYSGHPLQDEGMAKYLEAVNLLYPQFSFKPILTLKSSEMTEVAFNGKKLFYGKNFKKNEIFSFDLDSGLERTFPIKDKKKYRFQDIKTFGNMLVVPAYDPKTGEDVLIIQPDDGSAHRIIGGLPISNYLEMQLMNGRFYILDSKGTLFSCDTNGGNRKIEVLRQREDKRTLLDKSRCAITAILADPFHRRLYLSIAVNSHVSGDSGIWEFYPETGALCPTECKGNLIGKMSFYPSVEFRTGEDRYLDLAKSLDLFFILTSKGKPDKRILIYQRDKYCRDYGIAQADHVWDDEFKSPYLYYIRKDGKREELPVILREGWKMFSHSDGKSLILVKERAAIKVTPKFDMAK
jgi:hypothetical protein